MRPILLTAALLAVANANPTPSLTFKALTGRDVEAKPNEAEQPPQGVPFAAGAENQTGEQEGSCPFAAEGEAGDGVRPGCDPNGRQYIPIPFLDINPSGKRCSDKEYCKPKRRCGEHDHECRRDCECKKKDHEYFVHHYHHHHHDHGEHRHRHDHGEHRHVHDHGEHHHRHHYDDRLLDDPNRFLNRGDECDRRYIVLKGDTCWDIANRHQLGLDALRTFNPFLDPECHIYPGQTLCLSERRLVPVPEAERAALAGEGRLGRTEEERRRERDEELRRLRDEEGDRDSGRRRGGGRDRGGERGRNRDRDFRGFGEGEGEGRNRDRDRDDFLRRFNELSGNDGIGEERGRERQGLRDEFLRRYFGEEGERGGRDGRDGGRGGRDGGEDERRGREELIRRLREHFGRGGREGEGREDRNRGREDFLRELERYRGDGGEERCPEHHECRRCRDGEECRFRHNGNPCRDGHQCRRRGVERRSVVKREEEEKPQGPHGNGGFKPGHGPGKGERIKVVIPLSPSGEFAPPERQGGAGNPTGIRADADLEGWKAKVQEMLGKKCPFSAGEEEQECHATSCLRCEKFYEVRRGDTASRIWRRFGISGEELRELNPWLNDDFDLYPGEKLCVRGCGIGGGEAGECPYKQRCKLLRDHQGREVDDPRCPLNGHTCQEITGGEDREDDGGPRIDFDLLGGVSDGECAGAPGEEPRPGCPFGNGNGSGRPHIHHVHHRGKRAEGESDVDSAEATAAEDDKQVEETDAEDKKEVEEAGAEDADDFEADVAEEGEDDEDYGPPVTSSGGPPPADDDDDSEEKEDKKKDITPRPFFPLPSGPFGHEHGYGQEDNATATESAKPAVVTGGASRASLATALCVAFAGTAFAMLFA